nr:hypothetical protein [Tanacetum cinerariifolium]
DLKMLVGFGHMKKRLTVLIGIEDVLLNANYAARTAHLLAQIGHAGICIWEPVIKPAIIVVHISGSYEMDWHDEHASKVEEILS